MRQGFQVIDGENGAVAGSLKELSELFGEEKLTMKDITGKGKYADIIKVVTLNDAGDIVDEPLEVEVDTSVKASTDEILSAMPEFGDLEELKDFIKDMDTPTLDYIVSGLDLEWEESGHANIDRMRRAMSLHRYFFPELFKPTTGGKKKSKKYGDFTTAELFSMAEEFGVEVQHSGNEPIDRMRAIQALKKAGHLAE